MLRTTAMTFVPLVRIICIASFAIGGHISVVDRVGGSEADDERVGRIILEESSAALIIECFEPESGLLTQTLPGRNVELSQG